MSTQLATRQIMDAAITLQKIQNFTAATLLGNPTGTAAPQLISLGSNLAFTGSVLNTITSGTVLVASANGFAGTVAIISTTPTITLTTSITGILKGSGGALVAATANVDYLNPSYTGFDTRYVQLSGGTGAIMTGFLTLNADPTAAFHAATKNYVDNLITGVVWVGADTARWWEQAILFARCACCACWST